MQVCLNKKRPVVTDKPYISGYKKGSGHDLKGPDFHHQFVCVFDIIGSNIERKIYFANPSGKNNAGVYPAL